MNTPTQPPAQPAENYVRAIAAIAADATRPSVITHESLATPLVATPKPFHLQSMEPFQRYPNRQRAHTIVRDWPSFVRYVQRFKLPATVVFCDFTQAGGSMTACIDYHSEPSRVGPQPADTMAKALATAPDDVGLTLENPVTNPALPEDTPGRASWREHRCEYQIDTSAEWKRWIQISNQPMRQVNMATFIEENLNDISDPKPAQMLEMVKTLEATQGVEFRSAIRLDNGDRGFHYAVKTGAKAGEQGDIEIPTRLSLYIPIIKGEPPEVIPCRFKYTLENGNLAMRIEIEQPEKLIERTLEKMRDTTIRTLDLPVFIGSEKAP